MIDVCVCIERVDLLIFIPGLTNYVQLNDVYTCCYLTLVRYIRIH